VIPREGVERMLMTGPPPRRNHSATVIPREGVESTISRILDIIVKVDAQLDVIPREGVESDYERLTEKLAPVDM